MRDEILEIADKQMKEGGYDYLNFSAIAEELSTTRANLHYHFKTKEKLAVEVTKRYMAEHMADTKKIAAAYPDDILKFFCAMEEGFWESALSEESCMTCVCSQLVHDPKTPKELLDLSKDHFEEMKKTIYEIALKSIESKKLSKKHDPVRIAMQGGMMLMGLGQMSSIIGGPKEAKKQLGGTMKNWVENLK